MVKFERFNKKTDIFLGVFLGIIVIITFLCALHPDFGEFFSIENFFKTAALDKVPIWVAMGFTALVCFIGALVPFPIPYAIPITLFAAVWINEYGILAWGLILMLVLIATLANTLGDLVDYLIGDGAQHIISKDNPEAQNRWSKIILSNPRAIPGLILLFGLTPLPDSLLMVPLGMAKYDLKKTMLYMIIGRFFMMLIFALAGVLAFDLMYLEGSSEEGTGWILGIVLLYLLWVIIVLMVKIVPEESENSEPKEKVENEVSLEEN